MKPRISMLVNTRAFVMVVALGFGCNQDIVGPQATDNFEVELTGALTSSLSGEEQMMDTHATIEEFAGGREEAYLYLKLFFIVDVKRGQESERLNVQVSLPYQSESGTPVAGERLQISKTVDDRLSGSIRHELQLEESVHFYSQYVFEASSVALEVTESSNEKIRGKLTVAADQTHGLIEERGQLRDATLANGGRIGVHITFEVDIDQIRFAG